MRCASLNVQSGGIDEYDPTALYPQRMEPIKDAVHALDADTVGLVDTYRWVEIFGDEGVQEEFASLGYVDAHCIDLGGKERDGKLGVTILSKEPMRNVRTINMAGRNALAAEVHKEGEVLDFTASTLIMRQKSSVYCELKPWLLHLILTDQL
jgi:hypothetical protein